MLCSLAKHLCFLAKLLCSDEKLCFLMKHLFLSKNIAFSRESLHSFAKHLHFLPKLLCSPEETPPPQLMLFQSQKNCEQTQENAKAFKYNVLPYETMVVVHGTATVLFCKRMLSQAFVRFPQQCMDIWMKKNLIED